MDNAGVTAEEARNRAIVLAGITAFGEQRMDDWRELWHPDSAIMAADWPEPGPFYGRDAVEHQLTSAFDVWAEWRLGEPEFPLVRDDWVVSNNSVWGRGELSGAETEVEVFMANRLADGLVMEAHLTFSLESALAAVPGA